MSAFVVNDKTINVIVNSIKKHCSSEYNFNKDDDHYYIGGGWHTLDEVGQELLKENYSSVEHRYNDEASEEWKEYRFKDPGLTHQYEGKHHQTLNPIFVIKQIQCLMYQSCEHDHWEKSFAKLVLTQLIGLNVSNMAGYDEIPWGL